MSQPSVIRTSQGPQVGPYVFGRTLGSGSTGKVKLAKNVETGEYVAIKIVRKDFLEKKPSLKKKMRREISVLKLLSHPNVMALIDVFEIETHLFLVMEYVDGSELFEYLLRRGALPPEEALGFFHQLICGLEYCHKRLICHRDLKPENLLLDRNFNIKIADFGMTSLNLPDNLLDTSCGSPHYCDPMVVSGEKYDGLKADIWSCGVILYAMVTGRLPFDDDNIQRLLMKVQAGRFHLPSDLPPDLQSMISAMLTVDPVERITLEGIKAHPWFNSFPPRDYPQDLFEASSDPVVQLDPRVVQSLSDLGWGNPVSIATKLGQPGESMEKVFYEQLRQHRMFQNGYPAIAAPSQAPVPRPPTGQTEEGATAPGTAKLGTPASGATDSPAVTDISRATVGTSSSDGALPVVGDLSARKDHPIQEEGRVPEWKKAPLPDGKPALVRQSLLRSATDSVSKPEDDIAVAEAIESAGEALSKSWFDAVKDYFAKQADDFVSVGDKAAAGPSTNADKGDGPQTGAH